MKRTKDNALSIYLKSLRINAGLDQVEVGELIGKSRQTVSAYENGTATPNLSMLSKLASVYEVDITSFTSKLSKSNIKKETINLEKLSVFSNNDNSSNKYKYLNDTQRLLLTIAEHLSDQDQYKLINIAKILAGDNIFD